MCYVFIKFAFEKTFKRFQIPNNDISVSDLKFTILSDMYKKTPIPRDIDLKLVDAGNDHSW